MDEQQWQEKLDHDFPHGLVAGWWNGEERDPPEDLRQVPRAEVIGMEEDRPLVALPSPAWNSTITVQVAGYEEIQSRPCRLVKVTVHENDGSDQLMQWSNGLGEPLTTILAPHRQQLVDGAAKLGHSVLA
jgi:hypothetical protein